MYYVYILYSKEFDRYYVGQTNNLDLRIEKHNNREVSSTKFYVPWELKYFEQYETRGEAMKCENFIKSKKSRKFIGYLIKKK